MRKLLLTVAASLVAFTTFAQESAVKEAKRSMTSDPYKAEELIKGALTNPETESVANTWNIAGKIQENIYKTEAEKMWLRQPSDTVKMYNSLVDMCNYFIKCDELEQIPDEKGKVKLKSRKANSTMIDQYRMNIMEGGNYFYNAGDDKAALRSWGMYVDLAYTPLMEKFNYLEKDTFIPMMAYYSTVAAIRAKDYDATIKYAGIVGDNKEFGEEVAEYAASAYLSKGDTVGWTNYVKECIGRFPTNQYFFSTLINHYIMNNQLDEAKRYGDDMLQNNPDNAITLFVVGYINQLLKDYDKAIELMKKSIELDSQNANTYSALGGIYIELAQNYSQEIPVDINDPKYEEATEKYLSYVRDARKYYEKAREFAPDNRDLWLRPLYSIYYTLNAPEFEEMEQLMNN